MKVIVRVAPSRAALWASLYASLLVVAGCLPDLEVECSDASDCPGAGALCVGGACTAPGPDSGGPTPDGGAPPDARPGDAAVDDAGADADMGSGCVPMPELCNGVDDDCDERVDEGPDGAPLARSCYDGPLETQRVGLCRLGQARCMGGAYGMCEGQVLPAVEACAGDDGEPVDCEALCNGEDDDCDGAVDEGLTRACFPDGTEVGVCEPGEQTCESGAWPEACPGAVRPSNEICDGLDNDCDGGMDEGLDACECEPGTEQVCYSGDDGTEGSGVCRAGMQACGPDRSFGPCMGQVLPGEEVCNGLNDDCDGAVDENLGGNACTIGVGRCRASGRFVCAGVDGLRCDAEVIAPQAEVCNRQDDDCDGRTDEDTEGGDCTIGADRCAEPGRFVCTGDGELVCEPVAEPDWPDERCNGIDDDCNGEVDDLPGGATCECAVDDTDECYSGDRGQVGVGICRAGTRQCVEADDGSTRWGPCEGEVAPTPEVCDGRDSDCDGVGDDQDGEVECPGGFGATGICRGGGCQIECTAGFVDVDGDPATGCERGCGAPPNSVQIMGLAPINNTPVALASRPGTDSWAVAWVGPNGQLQFSHREGPGLVLTVGAQGQPVTIAGLQMIGVEQGYTVMALVSEGANFRAALFDVVVDGIMPIEVASQRLVIPSRPALVRRPPLAPVADGAVDRQLLVWTAPNPELADAPAPRAVERGFGDDGGDPPSNPLAGAGGGWDGGRALAAVATTEGPVVVGTCGGGVNLCALIVDAATQVDRALPGNMAGVPDLLVADPQGADVAVAFRQAARLGTIFVAMLSSSAATWSPIASDAADVSVSDVLLGLEGPLAIGTVPRGQNFGQAVLYRRQAGQAPARIGAPYDMVQARDVAGFTGVMVGAQRRVVWVSSAQVRTAALPCR